MSIIEVNEDPLFHNIILLVYFFSMFFCFLPQVCLRADRKSLASMSIVCAFQGPFLFIYFFPMNGPKCLVSLHDL